MRIIRKITSHPLTVILFSIIVCMSIPSLLKEFGLKPILESIFEQDKYIKSIQYILSIIILIVTYYYFIKLFEKRPVYELSISHLIPESAMGFSLGFIAICSVILFLVFFGFYHVQNINSFLPLIVPVFSLILVVLSEEIVFRAIIYRNMEQWLGSKLAIIIPSFVFGLSHLSNDNLSILGLSGIVIGGLLLNVMYCYSKRIWLPFFFHFSWNLTQILVGSNVSGLEEYPTYISASFNGPVILIGSKFGVEDSILAITICLILLIIFIKLCIKQNKIVPK